MAFLLNFFAKFLLYLIIKKEYLMIFNMELRNFGKKYTIHEAKKSQNQFVDHDVRRTIHIQFSQFNDFKKIILDSI